jgi:phage-Barnase-EndoU-ColicinE5/D-RelE like nuclease3
MNDDLKFQINELYDECLNNFEPFHRKLDLLEIPESLVARIFIETNLDLSGFWICIDNFGILHTLEKHGSPVSEAKRGQVAVEKEDFITMIDVCLNADLIKNIGLSNHSKNPILQFEKKINNRIFVVKEVRLITSKKKNKINRLVFHTMYKIKATN